MYTFGIESVPVRASARLSTCTVDVGSTLAGEAWALATPVQRTNIANTPAVSTRILRIIAYTFRTLRLTV